MGAYEFMLDLMYANPGRANSSYRVPILLMSMRSALEVRVAINDTTFAFGDFTSLPLRHGVFIVQEVYKKAFPQWARTPAFELNMRRVNRLFSGLFDPRNMLSRLAPFESSLGTVRVAHQAKRQEAQVSSAEDIGHQLHDTR